MFLLRFNLTIFATIVIIVGLCNFMRGVHHKSPFHYYWFVVWFASKENNVNRSFDVITYFNYFPMGSKYDEFARLKSFVINNCIVCRKKYRIFESYVGYCRKLFSCFQMDMI